MGALEQVTQMRNRGRTDEEIISELRKQKISPKEINDALNHEQIRKAVFDTQGQEDPGTLPPPMPTQDQRAMQMNQSPEFSEGEYTQDGDQGNFSNNQENQGYDNGPYPPQNQPAPQQSQEYYQQPQGGGSGQQGYDQAYQGYDQYAPGAGNSDTMVEISEQVFEEKSREMSKKLDTLEEFKNLSQSKLDQLNERLKRIESVIDRLQASILERIGSYGRDIGGIKKEMSMMQDTFARTAGKKMSEKKEKHSKKK